MKSFFLVFLSLNLLSYSLISSASASQTQPVIAILSFVGDITLGQNEGQADQGGSFSRAYTQYGPAYFLAGVQEVLANDDLTIINLEGVLADTSADLRPKAGSGRKFWFRGPKAYAQILALGSVEVANLANTHTYDFSQTGYRETIAALKAADVAYFGHETTWLREVRGIKIGFYGLNLTQANHARQSQLIAQLKQQGAQVIIANFHGGVENSYQPSPAQIRAAQTAIDLGAAAVIGHHPHVVQGITYYRDKVIAYSLGNFCFGGNRNPKDKDSFIFQLWLQRDGQEITVLNTFFPVSISSHPNYNDFRPRLLEAEEAQRVTAKISLLSDKLAEQN